MTVKDTLTAFPLLSLITVLSFVSGCVTEGRQFSRTLEQSEDLTQTLDASTYTECKQIGSGWNFASPVRGARVFWSMGKPILVYEAAFRDAVKSILQPLDPNTFDFLNNGIVLGNKNSSAVMDFQMAPHPDGQSTWTWYRHRKQNSQRYEVAVEFLAGSQNAQLVKLSLPGAASESVQQIWYLPSGRSGEANFITRSNPTTERSGDVSAFTWYIVNGNTRKVKKKASTLATSSRLSSIQFVTYGKNQEPLAIGISQTGVNQEATNRSLMKQKYHVVAHLLFRKGTNPVPVYESTEPLSSLAAQSINAAKNEHAIAWIREPFDGVYPSIEWPLVSLDRLLPTKKNIRPQTQQFEYYPAQLRLISTGKPGSTRSELTWWATMENDFAFLSLPLNSSPTPPKPHAVTSPDPSGSLFGVADGNESGAPSLLLIKSEKTSPQQLSTKIRVCKFDPKT